MAFTSNLETLTLELTSEGYEYQISVIQEGEEDQTKDAVSIAPPGLPPEDNILLGISGMQNDITTRFVIHDDGTDKANGTAAGLGFTNDTVVSVNEQRRYLLDHIQDASFDAAWTLTHDTGAIFNGDSVFVENINIPFLVSASPKWVEARLRLRRGGSV